jgi:hypothetical protein
MERGGRVIAKARKDAKVEHGFPIIGDAPCLLLVVFSK